MSDEKKQDQKTQKGEIKFDDLPMITNVKGFQIGDEVKTSDIPLAFQGMSLPSGRYLYGEPNAEITDVQGDFIPSEVLFESLQSITVAPYNKCFIHHDYSDIAIGKVVDKAMEAGNVYVLTVINESHRRANELWESFHKGFIDSFSVGGTFQEWVPEFVNGCQRRRITKMITREISYTSMPVNKGGLIAGAFAKALGTQAQNRDTKMEQTNNAQAPVNAQATGQAAAPVGQPAAVAPVAAPAATPAVAPVVDNAQKGTETPAAPAVRDFGAEIDALKGQMGDVLKGLDAVKDMIGKITTGADQNAQKGVQTPAAAPATADATGTEERGAIKPDVNTDQKGVTTTKEDRAKTPMTDRLMQSMNNSR